MGGEGEKLEVGRAKKRVYDLQERVVGFSVEVCRIVENLPSTRIGSHVSNQLIRCATSPAPNYSEAQGAESRRDFVHKLKLCLKELRETHAWLQFIKRMGLSSGEPIDCALGECDELISIFVASIATARRNDDA